MDLKSFSARVTFIPCFASCILLYAFLISIACPSLSASGGWAATYGGADADWASSIQQTTDGGYIMAGVTRSFGAGENDVWVLKLRPDGAVEWEKTYGGVDQDEAHSVQETSDGGYIVAGWTQFGVRWQVFRVLKLRANGAVEWQKTYGGGEASSIQETRDGGYVVAGWTALFPLWYEVDIWVLKLRADGAVEWQKTYGGGGVDWANSIQQTSDGGYIVAGWTQPSDARSQDFCILKLKPYGTVEWQKTYGGDSSDWANSIQQTSDGGYIVAGRTWSFGVGEEDVWVLKLWPDGTVEWQKTYGGGGSDEANSIRQTSEGGYIVAGETRSFGAGEKDIWVLKLGPGGTGEWQKTYGGGGSDEANSIRQTREGGYIVAGSTSYFGTGKGNADIWALKLGVDGSIAPSCNFIRDTSLSGKDSSATVKAPSIHSINSDAYPRDSEATVLDTNASVKILCP